MKKCPVCNSTRISITENSIFCKKCGYTNKKYKKLKGDIKRCK